MAATASSLGSTVAILARVSSLPQPRRAQAVMFNSVTNFCSLGSRSLLCKKDCSPFRKATLCIKAQASDAPNVLVANVVASCNVAVIGSSRGIGKALSVAIRKCPLVSTIHYYSIDSLDHLEACLSATRSEENFNGLKAILKGVDVVVIATRLPNAVVQVTTSEEDFVANATKWKACIHAVADHCPNAFIVIGNNNLKSIVPMAAEVLKQRGIYDPNGCFGIELS